MLRLSFRTMEGGGPVVLRGAYFRICTDGTLRGPDNSVAATFAGHRWQVGPRIFHGFECAGPLALRVVKPRASGTEHLGPFSLVRATAGRLFADDKDLRIGLPGSPRSHDALWREISLLANDG